MAMRSLILPCLSAAGLAAIAIAAPIPFSTENSALLAPDAAQAQLERATREAQAAEARAERFTSEAATAEEAADKSAREAAAIAAQIQQSEANISAAQARYSLARNDREALSIRLAERRAPLVRLTGALQTSSRRPLSLSAMQPGSLKDLVYVRAVLASAVPEIRERTAALRGELEQGRIYEQQAADALEAVRKSEINLRQKRSELAQLETEQRLASRSAQRNAVREGERALALAEEARDLDGLINRIDEAASLRERLAAFPGPVLRPTDLGEGTAVQSGTPQPDATALAAVQPSPAATAPPSDFQLPVQGRTVTGFGEMRSSGLRSTGLSLAPAADAQIVAPASGRVAFAGPYRGYGRIIIIEHPGGWTSLVTGLARIDVNVGQTVIGGTPLGIAGTENPAITLELRREGEPVNPLRFLG